MIFKSEIKKHYKKKDCIKSKNEFLNNDEKIFLIPNFKFDLSLDDGLESFYQEIKKYNCSKLIIDSEDATNHNNEKKINYLPSFIEIFTEFNCNNIGNINDIDINLCLDKIFNLKNNA